MALNKKWQEEQQLQIGNKTISLSELQKLNDATRLKANYAKLATLSRISEQNDSKAVLITITAPGIMRNQPMAISNCKEYLTRMRAKLTAYKHDNKLNVAGYTVVEPHKNGIPHLHIYQCGNVEDVDRFLGFAKSQALKMHPDELGAIEHRFSCIVGDRNLGEIGNYGMKHSLSNSNKSVKAWRKILSARRACWYGLPSDDIIKTLYKLKIKSSHIKKDLRLKALTQALHRKDYQTIWDMLGGLGARRKQRPYTLIKSESQKIIGLKIFGVNIFLNDKVLAEPISIVIVKYLKSLVSYVKRIFSAVANQLRAPPNAATTKTIICLKLYACLQKLKDRLRLILK